MKILPPSFGCPIDSITCTPKSYFSYCTAMPYIHKSNDYIYVNWFQYFLFVHMPICLFLTNTTLLL